MNNSGNSTRSAPSADACARAARTLAALPSISPMVGLSWASVTANSLRRSVMAALSDLLVVIHGQAVRELFDRGVEQLDHQHERDRADQFDRARGGRADEPGERQRQQERKNLLADGLLRTERKGQAVAGVDRGLPDPQQGLRAPLRP